MAQEHLAHIESQHFDLVQNVVEMQNQVADLEIEVEVWQVLAHQGQQPPIAPSAAPATPDELQGALGLSEDSVDGPPPASPDTSAGSAAGY
jgi:predicted PhzF superfamily epimerase YddE/YHI9